VTYTTSELALAAYLRMRGVRLISAGKTPTGKFEFVFDDKKSECSGHFVDFLNGEFSMFDAQLKALKKMIYSK
jgi:hypothetical protein